MATPEDKKKLDDVQLRSLHPVRFYFVRHAMVCNALMGGGFKKKKKKKTKHSRQTMQDSFTMTSEADQQRLAE